MSTSFSKQVAAVLISEIIKILSGEKKKLLWKSPSSCYKKKTPKIKPPKFWTVRQWKRNYCSKSICTASCNYSANSRKPCLKAQSLFLTLSCYWAWGWTKRWQIHWEVWIFLFSLNSFPFRAGGQLLESKLHAPNWWLELLLVTIFFFLSLWTCF